MLTRIDVCISTHTISDTACKLFGTFLDDNAIGKSNENNDWQNFAMLVSQV